MTNRTLATTLATLLLLFATVRADEPTAPIAAVNTDHGIAIRGYDPVAYVTAGAPTPGLGRFTAQWQGATYRFASAANQAAFEADPVRYVPQYGGYCAMAMSLDRIADADPTQWAIVDGKLYLNNNPTAHALWSSDRARRITAADANWSRFPTRDAATQP